MTSHIGNRGRRHHHTRHGADPVVVAAGQRILGPEWALRTPYLIAAAVHGLLLAYSRSRLSTARIEAARASAKAD